MTHIHTHTLYGTYESESVPSYDMKVALDALPYLLPLGVGVPPPVLLLRLV
jgi:hypothetical protein